MDLVPLAKRLFGSARLSEKNFTRSAAVIDALIADGVKLEAGTFGSIPEE
jgi:hypothetical protein